MGYKDKKMKMFGGGIVADLRGALGGLDAGSLQGLVGQLGGRLGGRFSGGGSDTAILKALQSAQRSPPLLTEVGGVKIPSSRAVRRVAPIRGARPPRAI